MADINKTYQVILSAKDEASSVIKGLEGSLKSIEAELTTVRNVSAIAFAGLSAAIGFSAHAAIEAEDSLNKAGSAVKIAGQSWDLYRQQVQDVTASLQEHTRFSDDDLQRAFAQVVNITGDAGKSLANLSLITDVATARNIDLGTAADAVGKAMQGQIGRLGVLFPELQRNIEALGDTATDSERAAVAIGYLSSKFKGLAEEDAKSAAGQLAILKHQFEEVAEKIGAAFLPALNSILEKILPIVESLGKWAEKHTTLIGIIGSGATILSGLLLTLSSIGLALPSVIRGIDALSKALLAFKAANPEWLLLATAITGVSLVVGQLGSAMTSSAETASKLNEQAKNLGVTANYLQGLRNQMFGLGEVDESKWDAFIATMKKATEESKNLLNVRGQIASLPEVVIEFDASEAKKAADELKRISDEMARIKLAHDALGFEAPDWQSQVANLRGNRSQSFDGILPNDEFMKIFEGLDKIEEKTHEISVAAKMLAGDFASAIGSGVGRVVAGVTSMARLAALSIKDIFRAVGEEILALFARVLAQLIATGILKLLLAILNPASLVIPTGGGFPDAFGGSGIASIPRSGGSYVPALVSPQQSSFGGGNGGSPVHINIMGDFIGSDENIERLEKTIARRMQYGQSYMGRR